MNESDILQFIKKHQNTRFYQPVIFKPNVLEIRGFWHDETIAMSELICSYVKNKHVLDVGCNTGFFLQKSIEKGAKSALGIDCDPSIVELSQEILSLLSLSISIKEANLNSFVPPQFVDVVFMLNVLHVADDPSRCFDRFLLHSDLMIIEHEEEHVSFFSVPPDKVETSPRANGRLLSYFEA